MMVFRLPAGALAMIAVTQVACLSYMSTPRTGLKLNYLSNREPQETMNWTEKRLPDVSVPLLEGGAWRPSLVRDQPTVLLVLTQCGHCGAPYLMVWDEYQRHHPGFSVLAVSGDDPTAIRDVVRRELPRGTKLKFGTYAGTDALRRWEILNTPRVFVLTQGGRVAFAHPGVYDEVGAQDALARYLVHSTRVASSTKVRKSLP